MIPPADVDDGVRKVKLLDMIIHGFFLLRKHSPSERASRHETASNHSPTYLISQPHDAPRRAHGDETAGDKSLHTSPFGSLCQGDLILLLSRANAADDNVDVIDSIHQFLLGRFQITLANADTTILEGQKGRFMDRLGPYKSIYLLERKEEAFCQRGSSCDYPMTIFLTNWPSSKSPFVMEPPVSPVTPTTRTFVLAMVVLMNDRLCVLPVDTRVRLYF